MSSSTSTTATTSKTINAQANALWQKQPKANAEFFALTYGALVAELVRDLEQTTEIQAELDRMGHSIGIRFIEEVLAKAPELKVSQQFMETVDVVKVAMKLFLGVTVEIVTSADDQYIVKMNENPLMVFVELPEDRQDLQYSQLLAGMLRGMLEMLQFDCDVSISSSTTTGNKEIHELKVVLKQVLQGGAGEEYQEE
ncbi:hypothetical protein FisN_20Hh219 [Fistulifera solaris]|uniref:Trafficking protein particle complex subunit n=1 Tax=Fistulifera solaris TaxID=1519565 RepID=A0A1Z5JJY6_FISSO|nr:hypothetical protein FisN_20Hh219 [Fistulifera solaris]|eukprot:GAX14162.1 hypothetical protein FisN_20Hh219 [Fistulifera solaris]